MNPQHLIKEKSKQICDTLACLLLPDAPLDCVNIQVDGYHLVSMKVVLGPSGGY